MADEDEIRLMAYYIWQKEGCIDGKNCEHWTKAEAIWKGHRKPQVKEASVLITPPPKQPVLLPPASKRNIRDQHKKK